MDLKQKKLSKSEWTSTEIPVSSNEKEILNLITEGYNNVNIKINKTESIFSYLKIDFNNSLEDYLFNKYFSAKIKYLIEKYKINYIQLNTSKKQQRETNENNNLMYSINIASIVKLKSADNVRVSRFDVIDESASENIYEFILIHNLEQLLKYFKRNDNKWHYYYYTINKLLENNVDKIIHYIKDICYVTLVNFENHIDLLYILKKSSDIIEKNKNLLKFNDLSLYIHQKQLFTSIKQSGAKLILYIAPTSTGKTISPLGISSSKRLIFVCAARHVGLSFARSAVSIEKKIAFAFGCSTSSEIRLHYFAATDYTTDRRSGKIRKVDNSIGDKVEIMICDVRSYLPAMYYMLGFNEAENIVTYWDEPTISMDYKNHPLHKIIKKNWKENMIPNVVLSSATLPKLNELDLTINDFKEKFSQYNPTVINISSYDCRKTIPLIDNNGFVIMPHYLYENYDKILNVVKQCEENLTLLRYIDLDEACKFCVYIEENNFAKKICKFDRNFATVNDIDMTSIKMYYLKVLKNILPNNWTQIYNYFQSTRIKKININSTIDLKGNKLTSIKKSSSIGPGTSISSSLLEQQINNVGIYVTTRDAYTLTDGPTIFLAKDLNKIAKFCIQQANIPVSIMQDIQNKIDINNRINERVSEIEKEIEMEENKLSDKMTSNDENASSRNKQNKTKVINKILNKSDNKQMNELSEQLNNLKSAIQRASIDDMFIPNKLLHKNKWAEGLDTTRSFTSNIDDDTIISIMMLTIDDSWKILLLLGIGVFTQHDNVEYSEIMKQLADKQQLYLIIAGGDYIFGTNYQFCHGYLSKDLDATQEKIIQSLGRIGRSNIQQDYTARFRDMEQVETLFQHLEFSKKPEVLNMNCLFNSKNIEWNEELEEYQEINDTECSDDDYIEETNETNNIKTEDDYQEDNYQNDEQENMSLNYKKDVNDVSDDENDG